MVGWFLVAFLVEHFCLELWQNLIDYCSTLKQKKGQGNQDDVRSIQGRKVLFADLVTVPKREQKITQRKKTFSTHLLSSEENQKIIWKADEITKKKEENYKDKNNERNCNGV